MYKPYRLCQLDSFFLWLPGAKAIAGNVTHKAYHQLVRIYSRPTCRSQLSVKELDLMSPLTGKTGDSWLVCAASKQEICLKVALTNKLCTFLGWSDTDGEVFDFFLFNFERLFFFSSGQRVLSPGFLVLFCTSDLGKLSKFVASELEL